MKRTLISIAVMLATGIMLPGIIQADNTMQDMTVITSAPTVKAISQGIELTVSDGDAHQFYIYSITGQMIKSVEVRESAVVDLPCGYYIVKCREWSKKIVVK
ncbi:MAG: hypothetical protein NC248_11740 [Bacteroides sp.]|nr:hypothetical protein [Lachnospiraceae bacterium]MCM1333265.1 hypothetical protein [Bacteroides sp.]